MRPYNKYKVKERAKKRLIKLLDDGFKLIEDEVIINMSEDEMEEELITYVKNEIVISAINKILRM